MNIALTVMAMLISCLTIQPLAQDYEHALTATLEARLVTSSARTPCPVAPTARRCQFRIYARRQSTWRECQGTTLPSGAPDLAARRWFKIVPVCKGRFGLPLLIPPQLVWRN